MGALGSLGIGLSVLFGVFLAVLAAEIYYMLCCRSRSSLVGRSLRSAAGHSRRVNSVQVVEAQAAAAAAAAAAVSGPPLMLDGFARDAALVGSFGGYPGYSVQTELVSKFFPPLTPHDACFHIPPLNGILFTIAEETKEEMELLHGSGGGCIDIVASEPVFNSTLAGGSKLSCPDDKMEDFTSHVAATSGSSTSVSFSASPDATPFVTPPTSPSSSSSDSSFSPSPTPSAATAMSRFSLHTASAANSASSSPLTAASRFSNYSASPKSTTGSPLTASSGKFPPFRGQSPPFLAATPAAGARIGLPSPMASSPASQRSSVDSVGIYGDRGPLGALFRLSYTSPSTYSPLRPIGGTRQITDFRHALPFSPPNAEFFTRR